MRALGTSGHHGWLILPIFGIARSPVQIIRCWVVGLIGRVQNRMRIGSTGGLLWASIYQVGLELNVSCNAQPHMM